jgi:outer membrane lipoprotein LolB
MKLLSRYLGGLGWLMLLAGLIGCQTQTQLPEGIQPHKSLAEIEHWSAEGKIAVQFGDNRESASFQWIQNQNSYAIFLHGPFGQGGTWLRKDKHGVTLENAKGTRKRAATAEALMQQELGWQVPVSNIQHWMRGFAATRPKPTQTLRDELNRLTELTQQGWQVHYQSFEQINDGWLPTKLTAKRGHVTLKIVIKDWQVAP